MLYSLWASALLLGFVGVLVNGLVQGNSSLTDYIELRKKEHILKRTVEELATETARLTTEIHRLENSTKYAQKVLKEKYHKTEDGEELIFFDDHSPSGAP